jgi:hypothetical protein
LLVPLLPSLLTCCIEDIWEGNPLLTALCCTLHPTVTCLASYTLDQARQRGTCCRLEATWRFNMSLAACALQPLTGLLMACLRVVLRPCSRYPAQQQSQITCVAWSQHPQGTNKAGELQQVLVIVIMLAPRHAGWVRVDWAPTTCLCPHKDCLMLEGLRAGAAHSTGVGPWGHWPGQP